MKVPHRGVRQRGGQADEEVDEAALLLLLPLIFPLTLDWLLALTSPTLTTATGSARRCAVGDGCGMSMAIARGGCAAADAAAPVVAAVAAVGLVVVNTVAAALESPEPRRLSGGGSAAAAGGEFSASGDDDGDALIDAAAAVAAKADGSK